MAFAKIGFTGVGGATTVIAAPGAGKKLVIEAVDFTSGANETFYFVSGSTAIGGDSSNKMAIAANGRFFKAYAYKGHFNMGTNEAFIINKTSTAAFAGVVQYRVETV